MTLKLRAITLLLQLFGGKMLANIRKFLEGKKAYLMYISGIATALYAYSVGDLTLSQTIMAIAAALGLTAAKAGATRDIKNGK